MFVPKTLTLNNFLSHSESTFDYDKLSLALVIGQCGSTTKSNGAGKSSFFVDGMLWSLFGKYRYKTKDDVVKLGKEEATSIFEFELNGKQYKIERLRNSKRSISKLAFSIQNGSWKNISGNSVTETQNIIDQTIGFTYDVFVNSVLAQQGDLQSFTSKEQARKKELLEEILQLKKFERCEKLAKEKRNEYSDLLIAVEGADEEWQSIKKEVGGLKEGVPVLEEIIKEQQEKIKKLKPKIEKANTEIAKQQVLEKSRDGLALKVVEAKEEIERLEEKANNTKFKLQGLSKDREKDESTLVQLKKDLKKYSDIEKSVLDKKQEALDKLVEVLNNLKIQAAKIVTKADVEKEKLKKVESVSGTCPTCQQGVEEKTKAKITKAIEDNIEDFKAEHKKLKEQFQQKKEKKKEVEETLEEMVESFGERAEIKSSIRTIQEDLSDKERMNELASSIKELLLQKEKVEKELEEVKSKLGKLKETSVSDLKSKLYDLTEWQEEAEEKLQVANHKRGQIEGELKRLKEAQLELKEKKEKEKGYREELGYYKLLASAFGRNGIPSLILEKVAIEIEKEANSILREFATDAEIEIQTRRTTTSGSITESFNVIVRDKAGERPFELYSGGEAVRMAFALRIALSKILASRSGTQLRFLIIDENLSSLDEEGVESFMGMLGAIQKDFDKILVITHRQDLQRYFQQVIRVVKEEGGSKVVT